MYNGMLNVRKEKGYTSHDVVARLRGILKQKKIGHTGTLDPDATGVLPVCLGSGTKLCDMLTDKTKEYRAHMLLGIVTDTQDTSGRTLEEQAVTITASQAEEAVLSFVGSYEQIPPMYSAKKVDGKRLYELAREGKEIKRKPCLVEIAQIVIEAVDLPNVIFTVTCSKGTYIRTLCHDIGKKLGCGAAMSMLERTRVGEFSIDEALSLSFIEQMAIEGELQSYIVPVENAFLQYPAVYVKEEFIRLLDNGNPLRQDMLFHAAPIEDGSQVRIYRNRKQFCGIYEFKKCKDLLMPVKLFFTGEEK